MTPDMPFVLLLDLEAAFVSLDRGYSERCLKRLGLPRELRAVAAALARPSRTTLLASPLGSPIGFTVGSGIPQGCSLSGGAFALATVPMLKALEAILGAHRVLGYADDIALVVPSVQLVPRIAAVLETMSRAAGLKVNLKKSTCVPLVGEAANGVQHLLSAALATVYPEWASFQMLDAAEFLGTTFGPSLDEMQRWQKVIDKHRRRLNQLATSTVAPSLAIRAYEERVAPVLEYRAQFLGLPRRMRELDLRVVEALWRLPVRALPPTALVPRRALHWPVPRPLAERLGARRLEPRAAMQRSWRHGMLPSHWRGASSGPCRTSDSPSSPTAASGRERLSASSWLPATAPSMRS